MALGLCARHHCGKPAGDGVVRASAALGSRSRSRSRGQVSLKAEAGLSHRAERCSPGYKAPSCAVSDHHHPPQKKKKI